VTTDREFSDVTAPYVCSNVSANVKCHRVNSSNLNHLYWLRYKYNSKFNGGERLGWMEVQRHPNVHVHSEMQAEKCKAPSDFQRDKYRLNISKLPLSIKKSKNCWVHMLT